MITRDFKDVMSTYIGLTDELAYDDSIKPLRWGVCLGYPETLIVNIEDMLLDDGLHLEVSSYTKSRWTRFIRRYFRGDLQEWIDDSMYKLNRYPSRPFVASYSPNLDTGHNYGGCLSSLQVRISPSPKVILYSRACHIDKVGFLDLSLMHLVARAMNRPNVTGEWVVSLGYISAISQIYYVKYFDKPVEGHRMKRSMGRLTDVDFDDIKFGPLKRGRTRMMALDKHGHIPNSSWVKNLTLKISSSYNSSVDKMELSGVEKEEELIEEGDD